MTFEKMLKLIFFIQKILYCVGISVKCIMYKI